MLWTECLGSPMLYMLKPNPQCDDIWRWALGILLDHDSETFMTSLVAL